MYAKLSLRNARRSLGDYLLYITTLIVLSALMMFSNLLAAASSQNGLHASSVPLIISMVMVALLSYINGYMLRRRAKEFATYILLGMKKYTIAGVFFCESLLLGLVSFFIGIGLGSLCFLGTRSLLHAWFSITEDFIVFRTAAQGSLVYFIAIQIFSLLCCMYKVNNLQVWGLLAENRKNQVLKGAPRPFFWSIVFAVCLVVDMIFIAFITGNNKVLMLLGTNTIIFSLVLGIWAFYKATFHWLAWVRINRKNSLYQGYRLYLTTQMLSKITSNIMLNTVLSICLVLAAMTFSVGLIMPSIPGDVFAKDAGIWMSYVEISMCVVFVVIYFSILAVRQIIEAKDNGHAYRMMLYLGKTRRQHKVLIKQEIILKYSLPAVICLLIILVCAAPLNNFLNTFLPAENLLYSVLGYFAGCFVLMYIGYTIVAYKLCVRNL